MNERTKFPQTQTIGLADVPAHQGKHSVLSCSTSLKYVYCNNGFHDKIYELLSLSMENRMVLYPEQLFI